MMHVLLISQNACQSACQIGTLKELKWPQHSNQMLRKRQSSSANVASLVTIAMKRKGFGVTIILPYSGDS